MNTLTVKEKTNGAGQPIVYGREMSISTESLIGISTKSLYVRTAQSGKLLLSKRGNGGTGSGDICPIDCDSTIEVNTKLFDRLKILAEKAKATN